MEIAGQDAELPEIRRRARTFAILVVVAFLGLAGRLFYLQVIEGDVFFRVTSDSIIKTETLPAVRGQIRDRKGKVLATVRPAYTVYGTPGAVKPEVFARLRSLLGMNGDQAMDVWERLATAPANTRAPAPIIIAEDISREAMAAIETGVDLPGIKVVSGPRRSYPNGTMAAHVLGFMNEISAE
jgi:penicillin-binding protein 2